MIHLILIFIYTAISIAVVMLHEVTSVPRFRPSMFKVCSSQIDLIKPQFFLI